MPKINEAHKVILDKMVGTLPNTETGKMFGMPCYKVNGKMAVGLWEQGIVVKVGKERVGALLSQDGVSNFEPQPGRVWKDWVLLSGDIEKHQSIFKEAVDFVLKETS